MGDGVAHTHLHRVFDARNHVAHIAGAERVARRELQLEHAHLIDMIFLGCVDKLHKVVLMDSAIEDFVIDNDTAEGVEHRVEDERLQRCLGVAFRCGNALDDSPHHFGNSHAGACAHAQDITGVAAQQLHNLVLHLIGVGALHVDFVDYWNDFQAIVDGHVEVADGLSLNALRGVYHQQCALAGSDGARHLVGEVDVARRVNQVERELIAVEGIVHLDGVALDGDAPLALQVHVVEHLRLHILANNSLGVLQQAVGQRALAVVDMRHDAEIANIFHASDSNFAAKLVQAERKRKFICSFPRRSLIWRAAQR